MDTYNTPPPTPMKNTSTPPGAPKKETPFRKPDNLVNDAVAKRLDLDDYLTQEIVAAALMG